MMTTKVTVRLPNVLYEQITKEIENKPVGETNVTKVIVQALSDRYFKNIVSVATLKEINSLPEGPRGEVCANCAGSGCEACDLTGEIE